MIDFLKKHWLLIFLAFLATVLVAIKLLIGQQEQKETTGVITKPKVASELGINPGDSQAEILSKFGPPQNSRTKESLVVFEYQSPYDDLPNEVYVGQERVGLVKERFYRSSKKLTDFTSILGQPSAILYSEEVGDVYPVHVFAQSGLAVAANTISGNVFEIWYFSPATLSQFLATWGRELSSQLPSQF